LDHQIRKVPPFLMLDLQAPKNFQFQHSSGNRVATCHEFGGGSYSGEGNRTEIERNGHGQRTSPGQNWFSRNRFWSD
jgi:hypothetical protein